jgi:hypothetical protein
MANEPYDPYIPGGSKGDSAQGPSNPKTAAIQAQIDDTVLLPSPLYSFIPVDLQKLESAFES